MSRFGYVGERGEGSFRSQESCFFFFFVECISYEGALFVY